jgi:hypothetical protein
MVTSHFSPSLSGARLPTCPLLLKVFLICTIKLPLAIGSGEAAERLTAPERVRFAAAIDGPHSHIQYKLLKGLRRPGNTSYRHPGPVQSHDALQFEVVQPRVDPGKPGATAARLRIATTNTRAKTFFLITLSLFST